MFFSLSLFFSFSFFGFISKLSKLAAEFRSILRILLTTARHRTQTVRVMESCLEEVTYEQSSKEVGGITQEENNRESQVPSRESGHIGEQKKAMRPGR